MLKIYEEDWAILNQFVSILQVERRERLSFADAVHELVEKYVDKYVLSWEYNLKKREH